MKRCWMNLTMTTKNPRKHGMFIILLLQSRKSQEASSANRLIDYLTLKNLNLKYLMLPAKLY